MLQQLVNYLSAIQLSEFVQGSMMRKVDTKSLNFSLLLLDCATLCRYKGNTSTPPHFIELNRNCANDNTIRMKNSVSGSDTHNMGQVPVLPIVPAKQNPHYLIFKSF